jgi:beta-phosphoglucomutase-like phosphatase (HAD superfamily)/dTDP-glucose pyrophosphorylase
MEQKQEYNNLIIFDLDGVLIDSRELHYFALNSALETIAGKQFMISKDEHLSTYDGLPTKKKLEMLTVNHGLDRKLHSVVAEMKQIITRKLIETWIEDIDLIAIFSALQEKNYKIAVASNSVRETVKMILLQLGLMPYVNYYQSNEDVKRNKPYPEMYWNCMQACNAIPSTTIIFEDSHIGRQGAVDSGARLVPIENCADLTFDKVMNNLLVSDRIAIPWRDSKLNVLIPMAGAGSRFAAAGYTFPKPLIEVHGKPMIQVVVENLNIEANFIYIVQKEHYEKYNLKYLLSLITPNCKIVQVEGMTEGAASTTLLAKQYIDNDNHLVIANSDQYIEWNSNEVMYAFGADKIDGGILTFHNTHPKWSYARLDDNGFVAEVAEKKVISENATVGVYYWNKGSDYVKFAEQMIKKNIRVNNEFYVAPVFNEAIADGKKIRVKEIRKMWGIGTPEDLNYFLENHKDVI